MDMAFLVTPIKNFMKKTLQGDDSFTDPLDGDSDFDKSWSPPPFTKTLTSFPLTSADTTLTPEPCVDAEPLGAFSLNLSKKSVQKPQLSVNDEIDDILTDTLSDSVCEELLKTFDARNEIPHIRRLSLLYTKDVHSHQSEYANCSCNASANPGEAHNLDRASAGVRPTQFHDVAHYECTPTVTRIVSRSGGTPTVTRDVALPGGTPTVTHDVALPGGTHTVTHDVALPGGTQPVTCDVARHACRPTVTRNVALPGGIPIITHDVVLPAG